MEKIPINPGIPAEKIITEKLLKYCTKILQDHQNHIKEISQKSPIEYGGNKLSYEETEFIWATHMMKQEILLGSDVTFADIFSIGLIKDQIELVKRN